MADITHSVAVRHPDGTKNLYHIENVDGLTPVQLIAMVQYELPESKAIFCSVSPLIPTQVR